MAQFTTAALQSEIQNDPTGIGYAPLVAAHDRAGLAAALNLVRAGTSIKRTDVTPSEILEAIDVRDLAYPGSGQLPAASQPLATAWFESVTRLARVRLVGDDGNDTTALKNLKLLMISGGQGSQARLNAVALRTGSRAEVLWGAGTIITDQMIADAGIG